MMIEERLRPSVERRYEGEGITVIWEPRLCIHTGRCLQNLPEVFNNAARPWINAMAATADEIARAIEDCPTGALGYERTDGAAQEQPLKPTRIEGQTDGPVYVRGDLEVVDATLQATSARRIALCRCGQSSNKPHCDLTHKMVGFKAP
jgi:uncharacterized Fe-S cluster protein YjdI/CDGSH-type Zn-finger protein